MPSAHACFSRAMDCRAHRIQAVVNDNAESGKFCAGVLSCARCGRRCLKRCSRIGLVVTITAWLKAKCRYSTWFSGFVTASSPTFNFKWSGNPSAQSRKARTAACTRSEKDVGCRFRTYRVLTALLSILARRTDMMTYSKSSKSPRTSCERPVSEGSPISILSSGMEGGQPIFEAQSRSNRYAVHHRRHRCSRMTGSRSCVSPTSMWRPRMMHSRRAWLARRMAVCRRFMEEAYRACDLVSLGLSHCRREDRSNQVPSGDALPPSPTSVVRMAYVQVAWLGPSTARLGTAHSEAHIARRRPLRGQAMPRCGTEEASRTTWDWKSAFAHLLARHLVSKCASSCTSS